MPNPSLIRENEIEAVTNEPYDLKLVKNQTEEICIAAVKLNGFALRYVRNQTLSICLEACRSDITAKMSILDDDTYDACMTLLALDP